MYYNIIETNDTLYFKKWVRGYPTVSSRQSRLTVDFHHMEPCDDYFTKDYALIASIYDFTYIKFEELERGMND